MLDPTSPQQTVIRDLSMVSRKLRTLFDARVRSQGLTYARARMLSLLANGEAVTQSELAEALEIEQPTAVRQLDAMEAAGLIERRPSEADRRVKLLALTAAGQAQAASVLDVSGRLLAEICDRIPARDCEEASRILRVIGQNIEGAA